MNVIDFLRKAKRGPQVILPKDSGIIIAETGCKQGWRIVEAGSGSGFLTMFLGNIGCRVYSYEKEERFFKIAKENVIASGIETITVKKADITKGIKEKNLDMVVLDMKNPEKVVKNAYNNLKKEGWLVVYSMHIEQVQKVWAELEKYKFRSTKILENIQREWQVQGKSFTRPKSEMIGHTGFLLFARKV